MDVRPSNGAMFHLSQQKCRIGSLGLLRQGYHACGVEFFLLLCLPYTFCLIVTMHVVWDILASVYKEIWDGGRFAELNWYWSPEKMASSNKVYHLQGGN